MCRLSLPCAQRNCVPERMSLGSATPLDLLCSRRVSESHLTGDSDDVLKHVDSALVMMSGMKMLKSQRQPVTISATFEKFKVVQGG